jgi:hypothetical protein
MKYDRRMPVGAEAQKGGGTHFRVWATTSSEITVRVSSDPAWVFYHYRSRQLHLA